MKDHNSDITIKCPQSGVYFHPKRLNQMFLTPYHGWTYRNRLKRIKEPNIAYKMKANLDNLKIIIGILPNLVAFNAAKYTELKGFDWYAADTLQNPFKRQSPDGNSKYYCVHGFIVNKRISRIRIYDIELSEIILKIKHSDSL